MDFSIIEFGYLFPIFQRVGNPLLTGPARKDEMDVPDHLGRFKNRFLKERRPFMYEITVLSHFSAAHRLRSLHGRCEELHGHNWKIEVTVSSKRLGRGGIVIDFGILKQKVEKILKALDHSYLNDLPAFTEGEPSSENIAKDVFERLKKELVPYRVILRKVTAWESETACATYYGNLK